MSIQETIEAISQQQQEHVIAERQAKSQRAIAQQNHERNSKQRHLQIERIKITLAGFPARLKQAESQDRDAEELAEILGKQVDHLARNYAIRIHNERQSGRPIRLELASEEAAAYFNGPNIKQQLKHLALSANARNFGAPLVDSETLTAALREEEKSLRAELIQLIQQA